MPQIAPFQIAPRSGARPTEVQARLVDYFRSHHEQPDGLVGAVFGWDR